MRVRDVEAMDLTEIHAEIELIESEARRMAPSEAEFQRRFPTMAGRLRSLVERRDRMVGVAGPEGREPSLSGHADPTGGSSAPRRAPAQSRRAPARRVAPDPAAGAFHDLREELLDAEAPRASASKLPPGPPATDSAQALAERDAEIHRLREQRDEWLASDQARQAKAEDLARELERAERRIQELDAHLAELESRPSPGSASESDSAIHDEVAALREERQLILLAHDHELERVRVRHRDEIAGLKDQHAEHAKLEERIRELELELRESAKRSEAALRDLESERDQYAARVSDHTREASSALEAERGRAATEHARLSAELDEAQEDLEAARGAGARAETERIKLLDQIERVSLDRNVVSLGILQAVQGIAGRVQGDDRFTALPEDDARLEDLRRALFQDLERFAERVRSIGTDGTAEDFLHALAESLERIPDWIGRSLGTLTSVARAGHDAALEHRRAIEGVEERMRQRVSEHQAEIAKLESTLGETRTEAQRSAQTSAARETELEVSLREACGRAADQSGRAQALEERLAAELHRAAEAEQRAVSAAAEIERLRTVLEDHERRIASLLVAANASIEALRKATGEH